jgi:AcrR family transcriptional regulator
MRNPVKTKNHILQVASALFNTQGYKATSINDVVFASEFTKGAIYTHFESKDELEKEALKYMMNQVLTTISLRIKSHDNVFDKLDSIFHFYTDYVLNPVIAGGCPLLNVAIESDDSSTVLKNIANETMAVIHESVVHILKKGIKYKQLNSDIDAESTATIIIASSEGAIMMSKLTGDNLYLKQVYTHLKSYIHQFKL